MSQIQKRKYTKRNFCDEAELQIKLLEQKAREDFLTNFSECENVSSTVGEMATVSRCDDVETKVYIPAKAKAILEKWMYEHRLYCYPTKVEKHALSIETGLSVQKISNWFINSRRRMLPKMLQTEGRNPVNFTISRKKKKSTVTSDGVCPNFLSNYAMAEESKIIDQNSIFYGNEIADAPNTAAYDQILQEMIVPYTESIDGDSKSPTSSIIEQPHQIEKQEDYVTRGILYDQATQSKCLFIIINSL